MTSEPGRRNGKNAIAAPNGSARGDYAKNSSKQNEKRQTRPPAYRAGAAKLSTSASHTPCAAHHDRKKPPTAPGSLRGCAAPESDAFWPDAPCALIGDSCVDPLAPRTTLDARVGGFE